MTSGTVTPDFQRTINVYDSLGGSQPLTFSFIKTGANTWAYEAAYAGNAANLTRAGPISTGTVTFNSDGTLNNVDGASPASGNVNLTIPWSFRLGPHAADRVVNLGTVGGSNGLTQSDAPSVLNGTTTDGSPFGSVTGVTVAKDGTVTAQFSNGLSQDVYKIPIATFTNPDGLGQVSGNAYIATKDQRRGQHQSGQFRRRRRHPVPIPGRLDGRSGDRIHQPDHHAARLFRVGAHHHHRGPDAAAIGTIADQLELMEPAKGP